MGDVLDEMLAVCVRHGAAIRMTPPDATVGVADNVARGVYPINGLRYDRGTTSGWFIWAGEELSEAPDFFKPIHAGHLVERCPEVMRMLVLAEGWRFLIAPGYEDVWFDASLLNEKV